jgi:membrane associated rhomboid family serine protease
LCIGVVNQRTIMTTDHTARPINPLPPIVWVLALPIIAMELVFGLGQSGLAGGPGAVGWRLQALEQFGYFPDVMRQMVAVGSYPLADMARLVTYPFVHWSVTHAVMVVVMLLALGKFVGEVFRWWAVLVVFVGSGAIAALGYTAVPWLAAPLVGGYPAVYGLIGAFTFLLWVNLAAVGANKFRAFQMIGFLLAVQLVFGVLFGGGDEWVADIIGFAAGFAISFVVSPGGWARVREKIRQR